MSIDEPAVMMQELLSPIDNAAPSGADLRYDPLFDKIAEARAEEDTMLPQGQWERPAKKADFLLVLNLTQKALLHQSKDLWLSAWMGEAKIRLYGISEIRSGLDLMLSLQENFWSTLYPQLEGDDCSLRAAPVHWALKSFAGLLHTIPTLTDKHSYIDYKSTRNPQGSAEMDAASALNEWIEQTTKARYVGLERELLSLAETVDALDAFCEQRYGKDGPAFHPIRTAIADLQNTTSLVLREKRKVDPDPELPPEEHFPRKSDNGTEALPASLISELSDARLSPVPAAEREGSGDPSDIRSVTRHGSPETDSEKLWARDQERAIGSRAEACGQIRQGAMYLARTEPESGTAYLLFTSLGHNHWQNPKNGLLQQAPDSSLRKELRDALQRAQQHGAWAELLTRSLAALALPGATSWLDLHRYIFLSSSALGYLQLSACVLDWVQSAQGRHSTWDQDFFEDDTPAANEATRAWLAGLGPGRQASQVVQHAGKSNGSSAKDLFTEAEELAASGDLVGSVQMLMEDAASGTARRLSFQRRLQVARLCLVSGQPQVALRLLQKMLTECDTHQLALWEGAQIVGEVLGLLLQSQKASAEDVDQDPADSKELLSRLFELDPARALALVVQAP
jgi:type VI secretion system protein ImpA